MQQLHMEGRQYIVVGNELANMLNISSIPHFLIYNKAGKLIQYEAPRPSAGKPLQESWKNWSRSANKQFDHGHQNSRHDSHYTDS